ncbi:hypothetical protein T4B_8389 [Trichinella pseudospiralis]|uniref:Uncharacterized protein n=1 Tax=Trichinella pseudospiralis TaxID=6337 RepID=A0A0V1I9R5_TRIPS|nr:hypothetical protein T4B_8389 [Trichinella pseudospiralis]
MQSICKLKLERLFCFVKSFLLLFLILDDRRYKYEGYKLLLKINFQLYATLTISNSIDKMM